MGHFKIALSEVTYVRVALLPGFSSFLYILHIWMLFIFVANYIISFLLGSFSKARVGGQPLPLCLHLQLKNHKLSPSSYTLKFTNQSNS